MPRFFRLLRSLWRLIKRAAFRFVEDDCPALAAAIAYYSVFSLPGVLVLIVRLVGFLLGSQRVQDRVVSLLATRIGGRAADIFRGLVANEAGWELNIAAVFAGATLLFSATTAFAQVHAALNRIWRAQADDADESEDRPPILRAFAMRRLVSFVMILGAGVLLFLSMTARAALSAVEQYAGENVLTSTGVLAAEVVLSLGVTALLFAGIFRAVPDTIVPWKDAWAGGVFTAILLTLANRLVGLYFHFVPVGGIYGPAGSLALILFWFYFVAGLLLFGAEFTQLYARMRGRTIGRPAAGAPPRD